MKKTQLEDEDGVPIEEDEEDENEEEEEIKKPSKKVSNTSEKYSMVEVPTQTQVMFKDNSNDKILDTTTLLCKIANDIEIIKKNLI